jgi:hypothetical protein
MLAAVQQFKECTQEDISRKLQHTSAAGGLRTLNNNRSIARFVNCEKQLTSLIHNTDFNNQMHRQIELGRIIKKRIAPTTLEAEFGSPMASPK